MSYNVDFLIAGLAILLLILWHFLGKKRAEDLNNQVFLFFAIVGSLDLVTELISSYYIISEKGYFGIASVLVTTIFYLFQAVIPFALICYVQTLYENKIISAKRMLLSGLPTFVLIGIVLTNPFTEKLFYFDV